MWNTIKGWFKKEKPMAVVDREEPVYQVPPKQRTGKSSQTKSYPRTSAVPTQTYVPPTQHVDTSFQDTALTYLVLDSLLDSTPSRQVESVTVPTVSAPEPVQSYSSSESSSSPYSSYDDSSSSRYSSDSSSSYSSYDSGSSDSSSSYSSD